MSHLTPNQYRELADKLHAQRYSLYEQVKEHVRESEDDRAIDLRSQLNDEGDLSVADLSRDMKLEQIDREIEQLREVDAAELRMEKGTYGYCVECDREIKPARLQVQPTASRCLECQQLYERTHQTRAQGHTNW